MGIKNTHGFTIIEVMLFLAVTGLLAIGILAGSGVAIGQQRYRDSVNSMKSLLQEQYNQTSNTVNSRPGDEACSNAVVVEPPASVPSPQARGTSDCLIMGKLVVVGADGKQLTASSVIGYRTSDTADVEATDIAELTTNYVLGVSPDGQLNDTVEWDARIVEPKSTTAFPVSILVIRSPLGGSVMTFVREGVQTNLNSVISGGITTENTDLCVDASLGSFVGKRLAVRVNAYATAASAIEIPSESDNICD